MTRADEKDFLAKVKNIINGKKAKISNPDFNRDKVYNETVGKKAAAAGAGSSVNRPEGYQDNIVNEIRNNQVKAQYPTADDIPNVSKANMAEHDEDVDTLIEALAMFMPASVIERGGMKLIGKLIGKLGGKKFAPEIVEGIISKKFSPKIGHSNPRSPFTMKRPIQTLEDKANSEMGYAALNQEVDEYEAAMATMDKYNKIKADMTPAYVNKYPERVGPDGRIFKTKEDVYDDVFGKNNRYEDRNGNVYEDSLGDETDIEEFLNGDKDISKYGKIYEDTITVKGKTYDWNPDFGWYSWSPNGDRKIPNEQLNKLLGGAVTP